MKFTAKKSLLLLASVAGFGLLITFLLPAQAPAELYRSGRAAVLKKDWKSATSAADRLQHLPAWKAHAALLRGYVARGRGQLNEALLLFSSANHNPATRTEAYFQAGSICYQQQQYSQATLLLRQVLEWQPDHTDALRLLAASWYDIGAMEKAIQNLREVVRLAPADYRPVYMQATILRDFERFEDAALAFAEAAEKTPSNSTVALEIHAEWGDCLIQLRRWEQALAVLQKAGNWPDVVALKAQAMYSLRRFDEASSLANQALTLDPTQPDAALVAAATSERRNQIDAGLQLLTNCLQKHPFDLRLHNRMAELLATLNRTAEAELFRKQAAEIAALRARLSAAQQELVRDTATVEKRLEIAAVAEQLGELKTAEQWLRAAAGMAPDQLAPATALQQFLQRHPTAQNTSNPAPAQNSAATNAGSADF